MSTGKREGQMPVFSEKGGDPERVRESQRRRFADVGLVDQVIEHDKRWRNRNHLSRRSAISLFLRLQFSTRQSN